MRLTKLQSARKLLSLLLALIFSLGSVTGDPRLFAQSIEMLRPDFSETPAADFFAAFPAELGTLKDLYLPTNGSEASFIVHVQDAHANPDAQSKIRDILKWVRSQYAAGSDPLTVALEGSVGELHPEYLDFNGHPEMEEAITRDLHEKGELTGAELLALELHRQSRQDKNKKSAIHFEGVETLELYRENLKTYRELIYKKEEIETLLTPLRSDLEIAKSKFLSAELRDFFRERERRKDGKFGAGNVSPQLQVYFAYFAAQLKEKLSIDLADPLEQVRFPNYVRVLALERIEKRTDLSKLTKEKEDLIEKLRNTKDFEALKLAEALPRKNATYTRSAGESLVAVSEKTKIDLGAHSNFMAVFVMNVLRDEIDSDRLFDEIDSLEHLLTEKLAKSDEEKKLVKSLEEFNFLENLLSLKMTRDGFAKVEADLSAVEPSAWSLRLQALAGKGKGAKSAEKLEADFTTAVRFYQTAKLRDQAILENTQKAGVQKLKVLVSGGFHTEGLTQLMKERGIGYAVIQPRIEKFDDHDLYLKVFRDEHADLSGYFSNSFLSKQEALFLKEILETGAPALWEKGNLSYSKIGAVVADIINRHPVLSGKVDVDPKSFKDYSALEIRPRKISQETQLDSTRIGANTVTDALLLGLVENYIASRSLAVAPSLPASRLRAPVTATRVLFQPAGLKVTARASAGEMLGAGDPGDDDDKLAKTRSELRALENAKILGLDFEKVDALTQKNSRVNYGATFVAGHPIEGRVAETLNQWSSELSALTHGTFNLNIEHSHITIGALVRSKETPLEENDLSGVDFNAVLKAIEAGSGFKVSFKELMLGQDAEGKRDGNLVLVGEVEGQELSLLQKALSESKLPLKWKSQALGQKSKVFVTLGQIDANVLSALSAVDAVALNTWIKTHAQIQEDLSYDASQIRLVSYRQRMLQQMVSPDLVFSLGTKSIFKSGEDLKREFLSARSELRSRPIDSFSLADESPVLKGSLKDGTEIYKVQLSKTRSNNILSLVGQGLIHDARGVNEKQLDPNEFAYYNHIDMVLAKHPESDELMFVGFYMDLPGVETQRTPSGSRQKLLSRHLVTINIPANAFGYDWRRQLEDALPAVLETPNGLRPTVFLDGSSFAYSVKVERGIASVYSPTRSELRNASQADIDKGVEYFEGRITTDPVEEEFRPSRKGDFLVIPELTQEERLKYIRIALQSLARGEGVYATAAAGAAARMNVKELQKPENQVKYADLLKMADEIFGEGYEIESKAAVPVGRDAQGKPYTFLGLLFTNIARLEAQIKQAIPAAKPNHVMIMTNSQYQSELDKELEVNNRYGIPESQWISHEGLTGFQQDLGWKYYANPADTKTVFDKLIKEAESKKDEALVKTLQARKPKAVAKAEEVEREIAGGNKSSVIYPSEKDPLGHGEFYHQLVSKGILLELIGDDFENPKTRWISFRNIDNAAATYDEDWLISLGIFIDDQLDMQPEVSLRGRGQKGGGLIVNKRGTHRLTEDPSFVATFKAMVKELEAQGFQRVGLDKDGKLTGDFKNQLRSRIQSGQSVVLEPSRMMYEGETITDIEKLNEILDSSDDRIIAFRDEDGKEHLFRIVTSADTYGFNDAVALYSPFYILDVYRMPGQSRREAFEEMKRAREEGTLEAFAERGRKALPYLVDPKPAKDNPEVVTAKIETNKWQATSKVPDDTKIRAVGVYGVGNLDMAAYDAADEQGKQKQTVHLRMLATKSFSGAVESYDSNQKFIDPIIRTVTQASLFPAAAASGILSSSETESVDTMLAKFTDTASSEAGVPGKSVTSSVDSMLEFQEDAEVSRMAQELRSLITQPHVTAFPQFAVLRQNLSAAADLLEQDNLPRAIQKLNETIIFLQPFADQSGVTSGARTANDVRPKLVRIQSRLEQIQSSRSELRTLIAANELQRIGDFIAAHAPELIVAAVVAGGVLFALSLLPGPLSPEESKRQNLLVANHLGKIALNPAEINLLEDNRTIRTGEEYNQDAGPLSLFQLHLIEQKGLLRLTPETNQASIDLLQQLLEAIIDRSLRARDVNWDAVSWSSVLKDLQDMGPRESLLSQGLDYDIQFSPAREERVFEEPVYSQPDNPNVDVPMLVSGNVWHVTQHPQTFRISASPRSELRDLVGQVIEGGWQFVVEHPVIFGAIAVWFGAGMLLLGWEAYREAASEKEENAKNLENERSDLLADLALGKLILSDQEIEELRAFKGLRRAYREVLNSRRYLVPKVFFWEVDRLRQVGELRRKLVDGELAGTIVLTEEEKKNLTDANVRYRFEELQKLEIKAQIRKGVSDNANLLAETEKISLEGPSSERSIEEFKNLKEVSFLRARLLAMNGKTLILSDQERGQVESAGFTVSRATLLEKIGALRFRAKQGELIVHESDFDKIKQNSNAVDIPAALEPIAKLRQLYRDAKIDTQTSGLFSLLQQGYKDEEMRLLRLRTERGWYGVSSNDKVIIVPGIAESERDVILLEEFWQNVEGKNFPGFDWGKVSFEYILRQLRSLSVGQKYAIHFSPYREWAETIPAEWIDNSLNYGGTGSVDYYPEHEVARSSPQALWIESEPRSELRSGEVDWILSSLQARENRLQGLIRDLYAGKSGEQISRGTLDLIQQETAKLHHLQDQRNAVNAVLKTNRKNELTVALRELKIASDEHDAAEQAWASFTQSVFSVDWYQPDPATDREHALLAARKEQAAETFRAADEAYFSILNLQPLSRSELRMLTGTQPLDESTIRVIDNVWQWALVDHPVLFFGTLAAAAAFALGTSLAEPLIRDWKDKREAAGFREEQASNILLSARDGHLLLSRAQIARLDQMRGDASIRSGFTEFASIRAIGALRKKISDDWVAGATLLTGEDAEALMDINIDLSHDELTLIQERGMLYFNANNGKTVLTEAELREALNPQAHGNANPTRMIALFSLRDLGARRLEVVEDERIGRLKLTPAEMERLRNGAEDPRKLEALGKLRRALVEELAYLPESVRSEIETSLASYTVNQYSDLLESGTLRRQLLKQDGQSLVLLPAERERVLEGDLEVTDARRLLIISKLRYDSRQPGYLASEKDIAEINQTFEQQGYWGDTEWLVATFSQFSRLRALLSEAGIAPEESELIRILKSVKNSFVVEQLLRYPEAGTDAVLLENFVRRLKDKTVEWRSVDLLYILRQLQNLKPGQGYEIDFTPVRTWQEVEMMNNDQAWESGNTDPVPYNVTRTEEQIIAIRPLDGEERGAAPDLRSELRSKLRTGTDTFDNAAKAKIVSLRKEFDAVWTAITAPLIPGSGMTGHGIIEDTVRNQILSDFNDRDFSQTPARIDLLIETYNRQPIPSRNDRETIVRRLQDFREQVAFLEPMTQEQQRRRAALKEEFLARLGEYFSGSEIMELVRKAMNQKTNYRVVAEVEKRTALVSEKSLVEKAGAFDQESYDTALEQYQEQARSASEWYAAGAREPQREDYYRKYTVSEDVVVEKEVLTGVSAIVEPAQGLKASERFVITITDAHTELRGLVEAKKVAESLGLGLRPGELDQYQIIDDLERFVAQRMRRDMQGKNQEQLRRVADTLIRNKMTIYQNDTEVSRALSDIGRSPLNANQITDLVTLRLRDLAAGRSELRVDDWSQNRDFVEMVPDLKKLAESDFIKMSEAISAYRREVAEKQSAVDYEKRRGAFSKFTDELIRLDIRRDFSPMLTRVFAEAVRTDNFTLALTPASTQISTLPEEQEAFPGTQSSSQSRSVVRRPWTLEVVPGVRSELRAGRPAKEEVRVGVLGAAGALTTIQNLLNAGAKVTGIDSEDRRRWVGENIPKGARSKAASFEFLPQNSTNIEELIRQNDVIYLDSILTPDLDYERYKNQLLGLAMDIGNALKAVRAEKTPANRKVFILRAMVGVETSDQVFEKIKWHSAGDLNFDVVYQPDLSFRTETGDVVEPYAIIGLRDNQSEAEREKTKEVIEGIYSAKKLADVKREYMNIRSAEEAKDALLVYLATKLTHFNDLAQISDRFGANLSVVALGAGLDKRIQKLFTNPSLGFGGRLLLLLRSIRAERLQRAASRRDKSIRDVEEMMDAWIREIQSGRQLEDVLKSIPEDMHLLFWVENILRINDQNQQDFKNKITQVVPQLRGKSVALIGVGYSKRIGQVTESPALRLIRMLVKEKSVRHFYISDPVAKESFQAWVDEIRKLDSDYQTITFTFADNIYDAAAKADLSIIATDSNEDIFKLDLKRLAAALSGKPLFDGINIFGLRADGKMNHSFEELRAAHMNGRGESVSSPIRLVSVGRPAIGMPSNYQLLDSKLYTPKNYPVKEFRQKKVAMIGGGYVGLVTGANIASIGHRVHIAEHPSQQARIDGLNSPETRVPIYEPGLREKILTSKDRMIFSTDLEAAVRESELVYMAVGTPQQETGEIDLKYILAAADQIGNVIKEQGDAGFKVIVIKSTVTPDTFEKMEKVMAAKGLISGIHYALASNPEFLREGNAIYDVENPDLTLLGLYDKKPILPAEITDSEERAQLHALSLEGRPRAEQMLLELWHPLVMNPAVPNQSVIVTDTSSSTFVKYLTNSFLAVSISLSNILARDTSLMDADFFDVRKPLKVDPRVGPFAFVDPGCGYGGSCFPKDVRALDYLSSNTTGHGLRAIQIADRANEYFKASIVDTLLRHVSLYPEASAPLEGQIMAIWGLSFKPSTDDMRETPAAQILFDLLNRGAEQVRLHDPIFNIGPPQAPTKEQSISNFLAALHKVFVKSGSYKDPAGLDERKANAEFENFFNEKYVASGKVVFGDSAPEVARGADALILVTNWKEYESPDFSSLTEPGTRMTIIDGRNQWYKPETQAKIKEAGINYAGVGVPDAYNFDDISARSELRQPAGKIPDFSRLDTTTPALRAEAISFASFIAETPSLDPFSVRHSENIFQDYETLAAEMNQEPAAVLAAILKQILGAAALEPRTAKAEQVLALAKQHLGEFYGPVLQNAGTQPVHIFKRIDENDLRNTDLARLLALLQVAHGSSDEISFFVRDQGKPGVDVAGIMSGFKEIFSRLGAGTPQKINLQPVDASASADSVAKLIIRAVNQADSEKKAAGVVDDEEFLEALGYAKGYRFAGEELDRKAAILFTASLLREDLSNRRFSIINLRAELDRRGGLNQLISGLTSLMKALRHLETAA